ncbi:recombinase family protein [Vibrio parahaemolyticus]|nr:recombinase family protein [Vibrio parahaemolyticus]
MTKYVYARTSTTDQNVDQQAEHLLRKHSDAVVMKEQMTGKTTDRPVFNELKSRVVSGDTVVVLSVSRLGRTTEGVLAFIKDMKDKDVSVLVDDLGGLDVTSSTGKLVLTTLAAVAEMQREEILDKQRIGIDRAKAEGKYKGRQQSPETLKKCREAMGYVDSGLSKEKAAKAAGIGVATLYRYIKESN